MGQLSTEVSEIWNFFTFPDFVRNVRADLDVREAAGNLPDLKSVLSERGYSAFVSRAMDFLAKTYRTCPEGLDWEKDEDWCRIVMRKAVDALRAGDMRRALTLVNNAVLVAPVDDPARCLNFVLHHRCFIMLMLGRPEDALSDMCLATQAGFPQHRMFIKHELTGHIYDALGDLEKAVNEFKKAMNLLDAMAEGSVPDQVALTKRAEGKYRDALKRHTDNGGGRKKRTREELRNVAPACGPSVPKAVGPPLTEAEEKSIKVVGGNGSFFVGLTNRIKEVDDLNCGPYTYNLVFKEDLSAGETVLVEKPFVTVLEEHFFADHCMVCLQWTDRPLPCKNCRNVVFCSTACEKQAASKHKPECGLLSHFFREQPEYPELAIVRQFPADDQFSCSLAILILRTILGQEISYWKDLLLKSDSDSTDEDCDDDGEGSSSVESGHPKYKNGFGSHDYIAIDSLSSGNAGMRDLSANILLAAEAAYVLAVIEGSDYWKNQPPMSDSETVKFRHALRCLIFHHFFNFEVGVVEIREFMPGAVLGVDGEQWRHNLLRWRDRLRTTGWAICPTWEVIPMSCDGGNVEYAFVRGTLVGRLARSVSVGERVTRSPRIRGFHYGLMDRGTRKKMLRDVYGIKDCMCDACAHDWRLFADMVEVFKCSVCGTKFSGPDQMRRGKKRCPHCPESPNELFRRGLTVFEKLAGEIYRSPGCSGGRRRRELLSCLATIWDELGPVVCVPSPALIDVEGTDQRRCVRI